MEYLNEKVVDIGHLYDSRLFESIESTGFFFWIFRYKRDDNYRAFHILFQLNIWYVDLKHLILFETQCKRKMDKVMEILRAPCLSGSHSQRWDIKKQVCPKSDENISVINESNCLLWIEKSQCYRRGFTPYMTLTYQRHDVLV